MELIDLLKGFLIGICASAPVGPIAILVIQKSLSKGRKAGFITGMGACVVDTVFAVIAIFALAFAQQFIDRFQDPILIVGGIIVTILGISMTKSDPFRKVKTNTSSSISFTDFLQAIFMGFSNPGAIFVIFALFAFFGIGAETGEEWHVAPIILSVSLGAATYWFGVTWLLSHFRKRFKMGTLIWINRITGIIVIVIGIALLGEGLFRIMFPGKGII